MDWIRLLYYKFHDQLLRDDEDIDAFIVSYLSSMNETDLHELINCLDFQELLHMVHLYINEQLNHQLSEGDTYH